MLLLAGRLRRRRRPLVLHAGADAPDTGRAARVGRQRAGGATGRCHAVLLVLGGAAVHRVCDGRRAARGHLLLPGLRPDGQRGRPGAAAGLFGWRVAAIYLGTGLLIAMVGGLGDRPAEDGGNRGWVSATRGGAPEEPAEPAWLDRMGAGREAVRDIVGRVWPYVVAGIAVGAGIHGYVPENFMASLWARARGGPCRRGADRRPDVLQRGRHHPGRPGPAGEGRGARHGAGLHDVRDRPLAAGDHHPAQGAQAQADRGVRRRGGRRHPDGRLSVQRWCSDGWKRRSS